MSNTQKGFYPLLLTFLFLISAKGFSQIAELDSLRHLVEINNGTKKIDALNALAFRQLGMDFKMVGETIEQTLELSKQLNYEKGLAEANIYLGILENYRGNKQRSFSILSASSKQAKRLGLHDLEGYALIQLGNMYRISGKYDSAHYWYDQSYQVLQDSLHPWQLSVLYRNRSQLYKLQLQPQNQFKFLKKSYEIRKHLPDKLLYTDVLILLSQWYADQSDFAKAEQYILEAANVKPKDALPEIQNDINYQKAIILFNRAEFTEALKLLNAVTDYYLKVGNVATYVKVTIDLADMLEELGNYDLSSKKCFEAIELCKEKNFKSEEVRAQLILAWNYNNTYQKDQALEIAQKVYDDSRHHNFPLEESAAANLLGILFSEKKEFDKSILHYERSLAIRDQQRNYQGQANVLGNIAETYMAMGQTHDALRYAQRSMNIADSLQEKAGIAWNYAQLSEIHYHLKNYAYADQLLKRAEEKSQLNEFSRTRNGKRLLVELLRIRRMIRMAQGRGQEALKLSLQYEQIKDSLEATEITGRIMSMQAYYQLDKQKDEIRHQQDLIQQHEAEIRRQRLIIVVIVVGSFFLAVLLYLAFFYYRKIRKLNVELQEKNEEIQAQSEELTESNHQIYSLNQNLEIKVNERTKALAEAYQELDTFFYRSSHDFRRPLTTFMGLAEVANIMVKDEVALDLFRKVKDTAVNLDRMLVKLQSISEVGMEQMVTKNVALRSVVEDALYFFRQEITEAKIKVESTIPEFLKLETFPGLLKIIIENLLENSIQFRNPENPSIRIEAQQSGAFVELRIQDNGIGIDEIHLPRITDMFFRGSSQSQGNGLGLYIVKKATEKMQGTLHFSSTPFQGCEVTLTLPIKLTLSDK